MRRLCVISLALSVVALAACGGDQQAQKPAPGSPENPLQALPNPAPTRVPPTSEAAVKPGTSESSTSAAPSIVEQQQRVQARNERARSKAKAAAARPKGQSTAGGTHAQKTRAPSAGRPCSLVTKKQARAIIGVAIVEPIEAPQGPTCIYQSTSGKASIMLTVQSTSYTRLIEHVRKRRSVAVSSHRGICGRLGRPMLYLPVGGGRVLTIAGPCRMASQFAAEAVPHL